MHEQFNSDLENAKTINLTSQPVNQIALKPKGFLNWLKSPYTVISLTAGVVTGFVALGFNLGGFESLAIGAASTTIPKIFEGCAHLIEHGVGKAWLKIMKNTIPKGNESQHYQIAGSVAIKCVRNAILTGGLTALGTELVAILDPEFVISKVATLPFLTLPATCVATVTLVGSAIYFAKKIPDAQQMRLEVQGEKSQLLNNSSASKLLWELTKTAGQGLIFTAGAGVSLFFASRQAADQWISNQPNPTPEMMKLVQFTANAFAMITSVGVLILVQRRDFELDWRYTRSKVPVLGGDGDEYTGELSLKNKELLN